jgi:hypothetical protein
VLRQLIDVGTGIVNDGFQPEGRDSSEILAKAEQDVFAIAEAGARGRTDFTSVTTALSEAFDVLQKRYENGGSVTGLPTGYTEFDEMTAGLQPTDLLILAARPAMGKTTLALNMAEYAAMKTKKAVAVFSMEMSASQLALRLISSCGRVNATRLRTGQLEDEDWSRVTSAIRLLREAKIFIDDTPGLSPDILRAKARRLKREARPGPDRHRLPAADGRARQQREPRDRNLGDLALAQGPGQGTQRPRHRALAAQPLAGNAHRQAPGHGRPARIRRHRAGRGRDRLHLPRRLLQQGKLAGQGPGRSDHRQAA